MVLSSKWVWGLSALSLFRKLSRLRLAVCLVLRRDVLPTSVSLGRSDQARPSLTIIYCRRNAPERFSHLFSWP